MIGGGHERYVSLAGYQGQDVAESEQDAADGEYDQVSTGDDHDDCGDGKRCAESQYRGGVPAVHGPADGDRCDERDERIQRGQDSDGRAVTAELEGSVRDHHAHSRVHRLEEGGDEAEGDEPGLHE